MATTQIRGGTAGQIKALTITDGDISASAAIATTKLADGANFLKKDGSVALTGDLNANGVAKIVGLVDPTNPQDAATRAWVLTQVSGISSSGMTARAATTANITLSGTQTVDGVALSAGQICLVKAQTLPKDNGMYTVSAGAWTRTASMDTWAEVPGAFVSVEEGTVNADTLWLSTADLGGTLNTTSITFTQLPSPTDILAGAGMTRTGQTIDVVATDGSIVVVADSLKVGVSGSGAITGGGALAVAVDNATIEISTNALRVKPGGIGETQLGAGVYQKVAGIITRETPTGSVNGANTSFVLAFTPIAASEEVFLNGILQEPGAGNDYTISGATITYLTAPLTGDRIRVTYLK